MSIDRAKYIRTRHGLLKNLTLDLTILRRILPFQITCEQDLGNTNFINHF